MPTTTLSFRTPFEALYNTSPSYTHLRVFGCLCYPNFSASSPHKLAPQSMACVFFGYPLDHKGFRCLDLSSNKIVISRHVVFDENVFPFAFQNSSVPSSSSPPPPYDSPPFGPLLPYEFSGPFAPSPRIPPEPANSAPDSTSPSAVGPLPTSAGPPANLPAGPSNLPSPPSADDSPAQPIPAPPANSSSDSPTRGPLGPPPGFPPLDNSSSTSLPSTHHMITRSKAGITKPRTLFNLSSTTDSSLSPIPLTYKHALKDPNWKAAMDAELAALHSNGTWQLVPRPPSANIVGSKWVFRHKFRSDGSLDRYKARLVAQGFSQ